MRSSWVGRPSSDANPPPAYPRARGCENNNIINNIINNNNNNNNNN